MKKYQMEVLRTVNTKTKNTRYFKKVCDVMQRISLIEYDEIKDSALVLIACLLHQLSITQDIIRVLLSMGEYLLIILILSIMHPGAGSICAVVWVITYLTQRKKRKKKDTSVKQFLKPP